MIARQAAAAAADHATGRQRGLRRPMPLWPEGAFREDEGSIPSVCETLKDFVGKAEGLPPDLAVNHDHYLYGLPKRP